MAEHVRPGPFGELKLPWVASSTAKGFGIDSELDTIKKLTGGTIEMVTKITKSNTVGCSSCASVRFRDGK